MPELTQINSTEPFQFYTHLHLREMTGLKARNLKQLLEHLKTVSGSVIYHHTHHFLQQHQYLSPEPPNDFAYWVTEALNEVKLGEKLASINICDFSSIRALREKIITVIEEYVSKSKGPLKEANEGQEFYFLKSVSFIMATPYTAGNLNEFVSVLKKITIHSIYFHMFESKLRLEKGPNDFSRWMENALEEKELARKITKLDPYNYTVEGLRAKIIQLVEHRLKEKS